jgi:hypothetical protein
MVATAGVSRQPDRQGLEPGRYTVAVLRDIKDKHESRAESFENWATEGDLTHYVEVAAMRYLGYEPLKDESLTAAIAGTAEVTATAHAASGGSGATRTIQEESRSDDTVADPGPK